jgi:hypothetical protein
LHKIKTPVSAVSARGAEKLLHLHLHMTAVVHKRYNTGSKARLNFVSWYLLEN